MTDTELTVIAINVRWPREIHRALARAAEESCRSLHGEIVYRVRESFRKERKTAQQFRAVAQ
jgi:hypothetical protein